MSGVRAAGPPTSLIVGQRRRKHVRNKLSDVDKVFGQSDEDFFSQAK